MLSGTEAPPLRRDSGGADRNSLEARVQFGSIPHMKRAESMPSCEVQNNVHHRLDIRPGLVKPGRLLWGAIIMTGSSL